MTETMAVEPGAATGAVRLVLRLEGLALLAAAVAAYAWLGPSWWLFAILILAPDLSFLAYLAGPRTGSVIYDAAHSTIGPIILLGIGLATAQTIVTGIAIIWLAHVGVDRALGYGLKYALGFSHTHLGRIGRRA